jgi:hypothetical protein
MSPTEKEKYPSEKKSSETQAIYLEEESEMT